MSPVVLLHLWGLPGRRVPAATARTALSLRALRRDPGLRFVKFLGTGSGRTFAPGDADLRHWALLTVWTDPEAGAAFERDDVVRRLDGVADERLRVTMAPLWATGSWAGRRPFTPPQETAGGRRGGPVAALTRARLRPGRVARFRRAVPPVAADLRDRAGLRLAVGIGETPVLHQGTFSLWDSATSLVAFAAGSAAHREVVRRTPAARWYAEEAFARLAVTDVAGTYGGRTP